MSIRTPVHGHVHAAPAIDLPPRRRRGWGASSGLASWELFAVAAICTLDMGTTLYWYLHGVATESNPLLAYWLSRSVTAFCVAKLLTFVPLLIVCAIYRHRYRALITQGLRCAMAAYMAIYAVSVGAQFIRW